MSAVEDAVRAFREMGIDVPEPYIRQARELLAKAIEIRAAIDVLLWQVRDLQAFSDVLCEDRVGVADPKGCLAYEMSDAFGVNGADSILIAVSDRIGDELDGCNSWLRGETVPQLRERFAHILDPAVSRS
jgi:hypothetical protein